MSTIVHIGLGKTATTSLQENVFSEIPRLRKEIKYNEKEIRFYQSSEDFFKSKKDERIVLMTTKASISYTNFEFDKNDTILFGRESAGVPDNVHKLVKYRLKIPMKSKMRSLNIASSVAIILAESLKQTKLI